MIVQPYDYFLIAWFILAGLSTCYVAIDQFRNNPEAKGDEVGLHPHHPLHGALSGAMVSSGRSQK
jgi:hypothetical protein